MKKRDTRNGLTEIELIEAAERVFAAKGIEAASLREISVAAGCANNYAVQYHFGNKSNLVEAIFKYRLPDLEAMRGELLKEVDMQSPSLTKDLVRAMLLPLNNLLDSYGRRSYCRFLLSLFFIERSIDRRNSSRTLTPLTHHIQDLMINSLPALPRKLFDHRSRLATIVFLDAVIGADSGLISKNEYENIIDDALHLAAAILSEPYIA